LQSFYKELGLVEEATKRRNRETDEEVDDVFVFFSSQAVEFRK